MKRWIWLVLFSALFVFVALNNSFAAGLIIVDDAHWWPGPNPPDPVPPRPPWPPRPRPEPRPYIFAPMEVSYVKVNTRINDQIAVTSVDQEFYNPNPSRLEGTFVFPIPKGAHIDKFTMEIDGKQAEAELLTADKARHIYEDIVRKLKDPALLEYAGRDIFKVRIFPIEPNSRKRITISYTQLLKSDDGLISYVLPLNTEKFSAKPIKNVSVHVDLDSKRSLKSIYSPSHAVEVKRRGSTSATVGYEASDVQPDADFALYFAPEKDEIGVNLLTYKPGDEDGYFMLLASPGVDVKEKQLVLKDVAFVLDTSGSMAGAKLDQAKRALKFCVENLNDGDRFEVLRFSTEVEPLFDKLVEANQSNRSKAEEFIKDLKPIGGTAIDDALRKALSLNTQTDSRFRPFVIIFLTDGRPTIGTTDEDQIVAGVKKRGEGHTRIFCFGIGTDVNTHLLDKITEETHAFSQYVLPEEDLEVKVSSFFSKIKEPVLTNPTLKFTGDVHTTKLYPSPLPDLFKGEQLVLVGRYTGKGDSAVVVEGNVNGTPRKFTYEVKFTGDNSGNEFIPRLWATRRVGYLLDEIRLRGENSELRDEVTELARKYSIVTPYTAYLIMEDEGRRNVSMSARSFQNFDRDAAARKEGEQLWNSYKLETSGEKALADARYGMVLRSAQAPAAATAGSAVESRRALGLSESLALNAPAQSTATQEEMAQRRYGLVRPAQPGLSPAPGSAMEAKSRLMQYSQQSEFAGGKTFFQNDKQWIDSAIQRQPDAKRIRVQFGSPEYFDLIAKNEKVLPWLALGQNVQFILDKTIYEVYE
jgi:Ca-activated chloride channel family protein